MVSNVSLVYASQDTFNADEKLHSLYPVPIQALARQHWTPPGISKIVADFLTPYDGVKVLDIGSGPGKFCLAGAYYKPKSSFFGIEQREELVYHAENAKIKLKLDNVHFIHGNLADLDFSQYDHFYFYNSFYENLKDSAKIDDTIACRPQLYFYYSFLLCRKLEELQIGTRLATFHTLNDCIPAGYQLVESQFGNLLKFWLKVS